MPSDVDLAQLRRDADKLSKDIRRNAKRLSVAAGLAAVALVLCIGVLIASAL